MLKAVADPKKRARTAAGTSRRHHWRTRARATRLRRLEHRHRLRQLRDVREPHAPRPPARADRRVHPVRVRAPHVRAVGATAPRPPPASALGLTRSVGATSGQPKPAKPAEMRNRRPQEKRRFEQRFPRRAELRRGSLRELRIHVRRFSTPPGAILAIHAASRFSCGSAAARGLVPGPAQGRWGQPGTGAQWRATGAHESKPLRGIANVIRLVAGAGSTPASSGPPPQRGPPITS
jgi:hypothetical protein